MRQEKYAQAIFYSGTKMKENASAKKPLDYSDYKLKRFHTHVKPANSHIQYRAYLACGDNYSVVKNALVILLAEKLMKTHFMAFF
jgi:hypothetical protein